MESQPALAITSSGTCGHVIFGATSWCRSLHRDILRSAANECLCSLDRTGPLWLSHPLDRREKNHRYNPNGRFKPAGKSTGALLEHLAGTSSARICMLKTQPWHVSPGQKEDRITHEITAPAEKEKGK
ncbi:hypothetical protein NDU88_001116 [Pleurodeles waltl]|uniref:Uncharacterized protein n=1 Tax=Pleurodeles waltl TaxID=8319 RepID=A0AAV7P2S7_PLEWA|nr:hypothetical protein NDU88_001116 [Pleurodeles waltl]